MNELSTLHCPHFGACSGCVLSKDMNYPPIWQEVKKYFPFQIELVVGLMHGWRTKAKLAIRGTSDKPQIGLFKAGSHDVQTIPSCRAHHPSINLAVSRLEEAVRLEKISIYNGISGLLRYAQFFVDLQTGLVQLVLVVQQEDPSLHRLAGRLLKMNAWHSIWFNVQASPTNRIFGEQWIHFCGPLYMCQMLYGARLGLVNSGGPQSGSDSMNRDESHIASIWPRSDSSKMGRSHGPPNSPNLTARRICRMPFLFHPASFAQAHWTLFEKLASYVVDQVPPGAKLIEFYAGIGVMGCLAASRAESVQLVENNPFSYQSFQRNESPTNVFYHLEDASASAFRLLDANCILVDPPRKGIDPSLLGALKKHSGKLIYVSCDFASFVRDADLLQENGWRLRSGQGYLLFPGTNHVEIVATLEK